MSARRWLIVGLLTLASMGRAQAQESPDDEAAQAAPEEAAPAAAQPVVAPPVVAPPPVAPPPVATPAPAVEVMTPSIVDTPALELVNGRQVPKKRRRGHAYLNLMALTAYRHFFDEELGAVNIELEVGGENESRSVSFGGRASIMAGATRVGLPFEHFTCGGVLRVRLAGRVALGIGSQIGMLILNQARGLDSQSTFTLGAYLEPTVDLWSDGGNHRVFLATRVGYDFAGTNRGQDNPHSATVQLGLGAKF